MEVKCCRAVRSVPPTGRNPRLSLGTGCRRACLSGSRYSGIPIVYGSPPYELFQASERGLLVLGGCLVDENDPTCRPGEDVDDFKHRLSVSNEYSRISGLELVLDREAATALVKMLVPVVGRTEIGRMMGVPSIRPVGRPDYE